ncbi:hypothetical protein DGWBC_1380 [Dehalogenimonas sp. WBC-2]|nr:hypothetical protein DGWBC_1380 [Dehalogenimonas sp. WBC-2]
MAKSMMNNANGDLLSILLLTGISSSQAAYRQTMRQAT